MENLKVFNQYLIEVFHLVALLLAFSVIIVITVLFISGLIYSFILFILYKIDERKDNKKWKIEEEQKKLELEKEKILKN